MNYPQLLKHLKDKGQYNSGTQELMHLELEVSPKCLYSFGTVRPLQKIEDYMIPELSWYFSGDRSSEFISKKAKLWGEIVNPDRTLNSNYGYLVFYHKTPHPSLDSTKTLPSFEWAARALENNVNSRQGMVTYNNGGYNFVGNKDYICSQHQAFYIREGKLLCYVALRSSDAIYGLPYNMVWWQAVYQQMLLRLRKTYSLTAEDIRVTIYSSHYYEKHSKLIDEMLKCKVFEYEFYLRNIVPLGNTLDWYLENIQRYISVK